MCFNKCYLKGEYKTKNVFNASLFTLLPWGFRMLLFEETFIDIISAILVFPVMLTYDYVWQPSYLPFVCLKGANELTKNGIFPFGHLINLWTFV